MTMISTFLSAGAAVALIAAYVPNSAAETSANVSSPGASPTAGHPLSFVLVGDSTVNDQGGWGYGFRQFLTTGATCTNTALNGRSSKSFIAEGHWEKAKAAKGDYYLIQFGHNDEPGKGPDRETDPTTTYTENLNRYIDETRDIGAKPVLVTPLTRRQFDAAGKLKPSSAPYVEAMKRVAEAKKVPLVDLNADSMALCMKLGPVETAKFNPVGKGGKPDTTHLAPESRVVFARIVVEDLRKAVPELSPCLMSEPDPAKAPVPDPAQKVKIAPETSAPATP